MNKGEKMRKFLLMILVAFTAFGLIACVNNNDNLVADDSLPYHEETLIVYSGAGLSKVMNEIGESFQYYCGAKVQFNYAGSAQLLGQMEINKIGDVYIAGSINDAEIAVNKGFSEEYVEVVYHVPAIAVPKGNPGEIYNLEDMARPGVKLILGDNQSNAIGKKGDKIFSKNNILSEINSNVIARSATVNEIVTQLSLRQGDAGMVWADNGIGNKDIEIIKIKADQNIMDKVPACVLSFTEKRELAEFFLEYLLSEEGEAVFIKHGFQTIKDED